MAGGVLRFQCADICSGQCSAQHGLHVLPCCVRTVDLVHSLCSHEIDVSQTHVLEVHTVVVGTGDDAVHPLVAQFTEVPLVDGAELLVRLSVNQLLAPIVRNASDVTADVIGIIVIEQEWGRSVHTALCLLCVLVFGVVLNTPSVEYTSTTCRERNFPDALTTSGDDVLTEVLEVLLEAAQSVAALLDDFDTLLLGNGVHLV